MNIHGPKCKHVAETHTLSKFCFNPEFKLLLLLANTGNQKFIS